MSDKLPRYIRPAKKVVRYEYNCDCGAMYHCSEHTLGIRRKCMSCKKMIIPVRETDLSEV